MTEHQASTADPAYTEPSPPQEYRDVIKMFTPETDNATPERALSAMQQLIALAEKLLGRVENLEAALRPFADHSPQMANARMCLIADGRPKEPAGGTWVSGVQNIHVKPNEEIFYWATDVYGRGRVEANMARGFEIVRKAQEAAVDQTAHIEGGGKLQ